jgi:hypothetical protein
MDVNYARMWTIHKPITTKDERCKANTKKGYTIMGWDIKQKLVVMVQA